MRLDFILMMLSQDQPIEDFAMMLRLLTMSVLIDNNTIGPIASDARKQQQEAGYIIERATIPLADPSPVEIPKSDPSKQKQEPSRHASKNRLRLEIVCAWRGAEALGCVGAVGAKGG